ncbi:MAG: hypothetical protein KTR21_11780 [Rhodobacteraceae bacterium]|nr:hypothetical protein [Paracoccaceae bacterium]
MIEGLLHFSRWGHRLMERSPPRRGDGQAASCHAHHMVTYMNALRPAAARERAEIARNAIFSDKL